MIRIVLIAPTDKFSRWTCRNSDLKPRPFGSQCQDRHQIPTFVEILIMNLPPNEMLSGSVHEWVLFERGV